MKCKKCSRTMERKALMVNSYYYECPNCHYTIGKPTEVKEDGGSQEEQSTTTESNS